MEKVVYSEPVAAGPIGYEIFVVEDEHGDRCLNITQCAPVHPNHESQTVIVTERCLEPFHLAYHRALEELPPIPRTYCSAAKNSEAAPRANMRWAPSEDKKLSELYRSGLGVREVAGILQRTRGGVLFRLMDLGFVRK